MATALKIGFLGAGKMATALAKGFVRAELTAPREMIASDPSDAARKSFAAETDAKVTVANDAVAKFADVLIVAVKPDQVAGVLGEVSEALKGKKNYLLLSIAAGVTIAKLEAALPAGARVIRVMPNTPALIGESASAYATGKNATASDGELAKRLLSAVGMAFLVKESLLDAVTGLSGSGPAYVYQFIEALSDGGVASGLPRDIATRLAAQTVAGAARMVLQTGQHPGALKDQVTSPGGTTIEGLHELEKGKLRGTVMSAVRAATEKSKKLGPGLSMQNDPDPTKRFSSRVENYVRYRPGYPAEIVDLLREDCGLTKGSMVADIGSGTGKLSELFLKAGCEVFGVEPNKEMREAGERMDFENFTSVDGTAEVTNLPDKSMSFITAGQAFHWFDQQKCRAEFLRILKPNGWLVIVWNDRRGDATPFLEDYEKLMLEFGTDYKEVNHRRTDKPEIIEKFFGTPPRFKNFYNVQHFDFEGLMGRVLSSSYAPEAGQPKHEEMLVALRKIFVARQKNGTVAFEYDTHVYYGHLT